MKIQIPKSKNQKIQIQIAGIFSGKGNKKMLSVVVSIFFYQ